VAFLPGLNRSWLSKAWSLAFAALIILPVTEPFQTVSLGELACGFGHGVVVLSRVPLTSWAVEAGTSRDTAVSTVPPADGTRSRLKAQAGSVTENVNSLNVNLTDLPRPPATAPQQIDRPPLVLRL